MKHVIKKSLIFSLICLNMHAINPQPGEGLWNILEKTELSAKTTNSKLDDTSLDLTGIYTALQEITDQLIVDISKLDDLAITSFNPFSYTDAMLSNLDSTQSLIEPTESVADIIDDCLGTAISQDDVSTTGFSITTPGRYYLSENITFSPASGIPAIEIDSDNVSLDLNGFTITQGNTQTGVNGIEVISSNDDIIITNGTIRNTSAEGVLINSSVNNIKLSHLNVLESGLIDQGGMEIDGIDGIDFQGTTNGILEYVTASASSDEGIDFDNCNNFTINNCSCVSNRGSDGGITVNVCDTFLFKDCIFDNNSGSGARILTLGDNLNIIFNSCQFNNNTNHGISYSGNENNNICINCTMNNNGLDGVNFDVDASRNANECIIAYCQIINNGRDGIHIDDAVVDNNFFFRNTLIENGNTNIDEVAGAINSYLGNYAFSSSGANYNAGGSTINSTTVSTTSAFSTQPVFWRNINATT